jgi:hypothetical protein
MQKKTILTAGAAALVAASLSVAALAAGKGILFPDWSKPTKGTYDAPVAEYGKMMSDDQPWTVTTMASSIMGKPLKGKPMSATGEIIDVSCYLQVGKHGDKHRDCGQKCARAGQPVGLLTSDGTIYLLIDEEHDPRRDALTTFRQFAVDNMANVVKINGTFSEVEGQRALYVAGSVKQ